MDDHHYEVIVEHQPLQGAHVAWRAHIYCIAGRKKEYSRTRVGSSREEALARAAESIRESLAAKPEPTSVYAWDPETETLKETRP